MKLPAPNYTVTDKSHRYTILLPDGTIEGPLDSVTKIIGVMDKPALVGWAAREAAQYFHAELLRLGSRALSVQALQQIADDAKNAHRRKSKDATDLGQKCHDIFEAIIKGEKPEQVPPELVEPTKDFERWRLASDIELVALELAVASRKVLFGGRLDALGYSEERGGWGIVDYKTSKSLTYGNEYSYQVGGYAFAVEEQFGVAVKWAEIVRFGKVAPFDSEARRVIDLPAAVAGFLECAALVKRNAKFLLGEPSFSTAQERGEEKKSLAKDVPAKKAKAKSPVPF